MDFISDLFLRLAEFAAAASLPEQIGVLLLAGGIPFIESYLGSFLGVVSGVTPAVAVASAVVGNVVVTFGLIALSVRARQAATRGTGSATTGAATTQAKAPSPRRQRIATYLDRFGVPGVCFLGPLVLASQITAPALIALGAGKRSVYLFQGLAIVTWGVLLGFFGEVTLGWIS